MKRPREGRDFYRPAPRDEYSHRRDFNSHHAYDYDYRPKSPPRQPQPQRGGFDHYDNDRGFTFRGAAAAADSDHRDVRHEFSYRAAGPPAPSFPPQQTFSRARSPPRHPKRFQDRVQRGRGGPRRQFGAPAHRRDILTSQADRATTPEQLEGMNINTDLRFGDFDQAAEDVDAAPKAKRAKLDGDKPKWSNPDPYTALPPPENTEGPKRDIVQVIRNAKRINEALKSGNAAIAGNADFISFDDDEPQEPPAKKAKKDKRKEPAQSQQGAEPSDHSTHPKPIDWAAVDNERQNRRPHPANVHVTLSAHQTNQRTKQPMSNNKIVFDSEDKFPPPPAPSHKLPPPSSSSNSSSNKKPLKRKRVEETSDTYQVSDKWRVVGPSTATPWFHENRAAKQQGPLRLHQEILDFYRHFAPQQEDHEVRTDLIARVTKLCRIKPDLSDDLEIHAFGSFAAGIYLPDADMDLVLLSGNYIRTSTPTIGQAPNKIRKLAQWIERRGLARQGSVMPVLYARVPLIKFIDARTGIKVDISFENPSGLRAIATYKEWKEQFPDMPVLVLLIKQLLAMYDMNEVVNGGIGGFTIICLVVSFLQNVSPDVAPDPECRLADLLMEFLHFYGAKFDHTAQGIRMNPPGFFNKTEEKVANAHPQRLTIVDPNNEDNDISGGSSRIESVFGIFDMVRDKLMRRLCDVDDGRDSDKSVLGCCWAANYSSFDEQRRLVDAAYEELRYKDRAAPLPPLPDLTNLTLVPRDANFIRKKRARSANKQQHAHGMKSG